MADPGSIPVTERVQLYVIIVPLFTTLACTSAVVGRFYASRVTGNRLGADDWLCLAAAVFAWGVYISTLIGITHGGLGIHFDDIVSRFGEEKAVQASQVLLKTRFAHRELWVASGFSVQIAILILYMRLFGVNQRFRYACYAVMGLICAWLAAVLASTFTQCIPLEKFWLQVSDPAYPGHCASEKKTCNSIGISHAILDGFILFLPVPVVWNLQTSTKKKLLISSMFALGALATTFGALRMACLIALVVVQPSDITYSEWLQDLMMLLEIDVGIICACLPSVRLVISRKLHPRVGSFTQDTLFDETKIASPTLTERRSHSIVSPSSIDCFEEPGQRKDVAGVLRTSVYPIISIQEDSEGSDGDVGYEAMKSIQAI